MGMEWRSTEQKEKGNGNTMCRGQIFPNRNKGVASIFERTYDVRRVDELHAQPGSQRTTSSEAGSETYLHTGGYDKYGGKCITSATP